MKNKAKNSEKKRKSAAKKKTNSIPAKKLKKPVKTKAKVVAGKKAKESVAAKTKSVAKKNGGKIASGKSKLVVRKKAKKPFKTDTKNPVKTPRVEEKITHGEDLHLIPVEGEIHPIDTVEANRLENIFQNMEEITLQQENRKVKDALGSRKNLIKNFRITRHR